MKSLALSGPKSLLMVWINPLDVLVKIALSKAPFWTTPSIISTTLISLLGLLSKLSLFISILIFLGMINVIICFPDQYSNSLPFLSILISGSGNWPVNVERLQMRFITCFLVKTAEGTTLLLLSPDVSYNWVLFP